MTRTSADEGRRLALIASIIAVPPDLPDHVRRLIQTPLVLVLPAPAI
jgi:hypothetical protein